jgi:hypothetical protein
VPASVVYRRVGSRRPSPPVTLASNGTPDGVIALARRPSRQRAVV